MSAKRISRRDAEQLFRGVQAGPTGPAEGLAGLLADAALPGRPAELTGEEAAVTAFRAAPVPSASRRRLASFRHTFAKVVSVKVAGAILAGTAVGGVALAAGNGSLPIQDGRPMWSSSTAPPKSPAPQLVPKQAAPRPHPAPSPKATTPTPSDLCRSYLRRTLQEHEQELKDLIAAAGGKQKIMQFCSRFRSPREGRPQRNTWPTTWPKGWPTTWPKDLDQVWPTAGSKRH